jgi:hypothetical protein
LQLGVCEQEVKLPDGQRLAYRMDYMLPERGNTYIAAVTSHTTYWSNVDVAQFMLSKLHPELEQYCKQAQEQQQQQVPVSVAASAATTPLPHQQQQHLLQQQPVHHLQAAQGRRRNLPNIRRVSETQTNLFNIL